MSVEATTALREADRSTRWYQVPIDQHVHTLVMSGPIVLVVPGGCDPATVAFVALTGTDQELKHHFRVFDTGQRLPAAICAHRGAVQIGTNTWHLIEGFTAEALQT